MLHSTMRGDDYPWSYPDASIKSLEILTVKYCSAVNSYLTRMGIENLNGDFYKTADKYKALMVSKAKNGLVTYCEKRLDSPLNIFTFSSTYYGPDAYKFGVWDRPPAPNVTHGYTASEVKEMRGNEQDARYRRLAPAPHYLGSLDIFIEDDLVKTGICKPLRSYEQHIALLDWADKVMYNANQNYFVKSSEAQRRQVHAWINNQVEFGMTLTPANCRRIEEKICDVHICKWENLGLRLTEGPARRRPLLLSKMDDSSACGIRF